MGPQVPRGAAAGARRALRCGTPTFQRQWPDPAPTPVGGRGGNFPRAEKRTRNLLGTGCLPGGGGGGASGDRLARGGGGARSGLGAGARARAASRGSAVDH